MNTKLYPLKRVTRWHYLECGHSVVTKQSAGFPNKKRCRECSQPERTAE